MIVGPLMAVVVGTWSMVGTTSDLFTLEVAHV